MWQYDAYHDSIITVGNGGTKPTQTAFTIFYNQGAQRYDLEQTLQPDSQMWIDIGKLISEHRWCHLRLAGILTVALLSCYLAGPAFGQDRYTGWCDSLEHADSSDLVQFLNGVVPDEKNAHCVTWALHRLGDERYEPAIHALVRLLDFRRPLTEMEKNGGFLRPSIIEEMYPAAESLEEIGRSAQPEVLHVVGSDSASATPRENAISVWMEFYKYERPKGVALLKQEENKATTEAAKQKFSAAARTAVKYCPGDPACASAAKTGRF